jgi:glycosyltransferase involved in cell wall biosynthesis
MREFGERKLKAKKSRGTKSKAKKVKIQGHKELSALSSESGINLIGYGRAEMGIGESCRIAARAMDKEAIPFGLINLLENNLARMFDYTWAHKEIVKPRYKVNMIHVNADQTKLLYEQFAKDMFAGRFNIGYWHWELQDFPEEWFEAFKYVQEVWVPSTFVLDSISQKSPVPVVCIPHSIEVTITPGMTREHFGIPSDMFLFLTMYDTGSHQRRKNPMDTIRAFKHAFNKNDKFAGLVIKINQPQRAPEEVEKLKQEIVEYPNIVLIEEIFTRQAVNSLINVTDCLISLHRAEGFGLVMAEAMYLGKPVIGTNWSGNTDFMNPMNCCPVNYKLIQIEEDCGPYKGYQLWADPDIEHAAYYMRKLVTMPQWRKEISLEGQKTICSHFSPRAQGQLIRRRLERLGLFPKMKFRG